MAETDTPLKDNRGPGPELRLIDRRAFIGFPELKVAPGVVVHDFALQIPDVTFPMNISGGAAKYQKKKLDFGFLELSIDAEIIQRRVHELATKVAELDDVRLHFRPGYLEVQARLRGPERAPVSFKIAFDGDGERLAVYFYDVRLYAFSTTPAARLGAMLAEAIRDSAVLPEVERRGANGFSSRILPGLVEQAAVARGYKMPSLDQARLAEASISSKGLRLRFSSGGLPPPVAPDEELLLALEGTRAFADAEELLAQGKLSEARDAYLRFGDATDAHPFAVERLLTLLVADAQAHELALDIAASLARRRERSATAIWAEAVIRERRGEFARASERFLMLCQHARKNQEEAGAFFAAEAAARASRDHAPQMAVKALHELLGLRPDHLPSLKALARASDQAKDRAGAIRAYRRLAALARDPADAADAHVQLARLCAQTEDDIAGARLHCEAALRLQPDQPEALLQLGELCFKSGEHLRAVKALDRLREVSMARHEVDRVGRANLLAGQVWESGLKQPENALLRYREAASLLPGEPEPLYLAARVAESLGKVQEALSGYQQAVELAGPAPRNDDTRKAAHSAHHALARLFKTKLGEPARAREHMEAALVLDGTDRTALDELLPYFRAAGKAAELADACEKSAAVIEEPQRRAALWAEAGELYRGRLNQPERAERLLTQALEADPKNRLALEGMLALAESKRDGGQLCRCLRALAEIADDAKERVRHYRRLAVAARDLAFDLELAAHAYREVLRVEPDDLPVLGELTALERRRSDMAGLAWALEQRSRAAETAGDKRLAAAALRELGSVLDLRLGRAGEALVALEKSARLFPEPSTLLDLANLSLRLERPGNARRALEDVLALLPKHAAPEKVAEVRSRLGRACELLGDKDAAKENYAMAFPLRRLDDELAGRLEALYLESNATRELTDFWAARAQALLQAGRPHDAAPLFFRSAQQLLNIGDSNGAILRLSAALEAAPTGERAAEVLEAMASVELDRGEHHEAARLFARRAGLAVESRLAARFLFRAAVLTRDTPREQQYLAQALDRDGTFVPARLRRAEILEHANPRDALADFEVALASDPNDVDAVGLVDRTALTRRAGFAALKSGHLDVARRLLGKYSAIKPEDLEVQLEVAHLHRKAGAIESLVDVLGDVWPRLSGAQRSAARREFAEGALALGRIQSAVEALRSQFQEDNDEWSATQLLSLLPVESSTAPERLQLLTRLIESASGEAKADYLSRRSDLHRDNGDLPAARADLLDAAQETAKPIPLLRALAELARQSHDDRAELEAWRLVLDKAQADQAIQHDAVERLKQIIRSRTTSHDFAPALDAAEMLAQLPLSPLDRLEAWVSVAQAAKSIGRTRRAEEALLEASRQGPASRRVEALLERASLLEQRSAHDEAVSTFEGVLALAPRMPAAIEGLQRNLRTLEDWEGLAEVLSTEATQTPKSRAAPIYAELASLYLDKLSLPGPGEAALRRLVTLDEHDANARHRLADVLIARGDSTEAVALLEAAAHLETPRDGAQTLREAAKLALELGDATLELRLLRRAHALVPASGEELIALANALYLRGAVHEAFPVYRALASTTSFEEDPDFAELTLLRLADLAEQSNELSLAESTLRRVVHHRPFNERAVERLAGLLSTREPRTAIELLATHAESLRAVGKSVEKLVTLARRASTEIEDIDLALRLFHTAAQRAEQPLEIRVEAANLLRNVGRTGDLVTELQEVAQLRLAAHDIEGALLAYEEEARLAQGAGRIDDALRTLQAMAEVSEDDERTSDAAVLWVRHAELLRDSKLDLEGAEQSLSRAWNLDESPSIAQMAMELARRRSDRDAEIDWLEKTFKGLTSAQARADAFVALGRLHLGLSALGGSDIDTAPMLSPDQALASLRQALDVSPRHPAAEETYLAVLDRLDKPSDIAGYYEEIASRVSALSERAGLLLKAADVYRLRAQRPAEAAAALLAARSANPDDLALTELVADQLSALGRAADAADFDALVLEVDPFRPAFERHRAYLESTGDDQSRAALLSRRAEKMTGEGAAQLWLQAADAFRKSGAAERAQLCETQAFEAAPDNTKAFQALLDRAQGDGRRQAELYAIRARAIPVEAPELLKKRAEILTATGEPLLAAAAWDDYLATTTGDLAALEARGELAARGGGPHAAQPFDRRLVQLGGESLAAPLRLKLWLRLGQAAVESSAWHDAVDAFETAYAIDPDGPQSADALSSLSLAYTTLRDVNGQYSTTLRLARRLSGTEADALYRRAVGLHSEAAKAIEALDALLARHAGDEVLYRKGVEAYRQSGRIGDVVQLHERFAKAAGGRLGARALLDAAEILENELHEGQRAFELRQQASDLSPESLEAAEALLAAYRERKDTIGVQLMLERVLELAPDHQPLRVELATLQESSGDRAAARATLAPLRKEGPRAAGYAQALETLERLARADGDHAFTAEVVLESAELLSGPARAHKQLAGADLLLRAGHADRAESIVRHVLSESPSREAFVHLVEVVRAQKLPEKLARALVGLAARTEGPDKVSLLTEAVDAWEAAGEKSAAIELVERLLRDAPSLYRPEVAANRFTALGAGLRALEVGFEPAMQGKRYAEALRLADLAGDITRARIALWELISANPDAPEVERLVTMVREQANVAEMQRLAQLLDTRASARSLWHDLVFVHQDSTALDSLIAQQTSEDITAIALDESNVFVLQAMLSRALSLSDETRERLYKTIAKLVPERQKAMLRELAELAVAGGRYTEAAASLTKLASVESDSRGRAALHVETGELYLHQIHDTQAAAVEFERALVEDAQNVAAVRALVDIYQGSDADRFVALVERLGALAGHATTVRYNDAMLDAYEKLGRQRDAYRLLSSMEETPERLQRRAALAQRLGLDGEALVLRERVATTPEALNEILRGYLTLQLVPFAVRLTERLLSERTLDEKNRQFAAERLSSTAQGAPLAAQLWPALLLEDIHNADAWTMFADALKRTGRLDEAALIDGFGAAFSSSTAVTQTVAVRPVAQRADFAPVRSDPGLPVNEESMPRLTSAIREISEALGLAPLRASVDPRGGVEVWMNGTQQIVIGAGALSVFGPVELTYAIALANALGARSAGFAELAAVGDIGEAAVVAFQSVPSSLGAGRVLAQLDDSVRGGDPRSVDVRAVLRRNAAWLALARSVVQRFRA